MKLATVVLVVLAMSSSAYADKLKVAIVPGIAVNLDSARVDALSQDLADALQTELDIVAVGGLEVRRLLPADGLAARLFDERSVHRAMSRSDSARSSCWFVVMVDATGSGAVQVDSTWVDVGDEEARVAPGDRPADDRGCEDAIHRGGEVAAAGCAGAAEAEDGWWWWPRPGREDDAGSAASLHAGDVHDGGRGDRRTRRGHQLRLVGAQQVQQVRRARRVRARRSRFDPVARHRRGYRVRRGARWCGRDGGAVRDVGQGIAVESSAPTAGPSGPGATLRWRF